MSADKAVTRTIIEVASERNDIEMLLWVASQIARDAQVTDEGLMSLMNVLLEWSPTSNAESWQIAKAIARMVSPEGLDAAIIRYFEKLAPTQRTVVGAMRCVRSGAWPTNVEEVVTAVAQELQVGKEPGGTIRTRKRNEDVEEFSVVLAQRDLPARPDIAPLFVEVARQSSVGVSEQLWTIIRGVGREDLYAQEHGAMWKSMAQFANAVPIHHELWKRFLSGVASFASSAHLTLPQRRRLDELADYVATVRYGESTPREVHDAFEYTQDLPWLLRTTASLGDFDVGTLSAEAEVALRIVSESDRSMGLLFDGAERRELSHWGAIPDELATIERFANLVAGPRWSASIAIRALTHSRLGPDTVALLRARLTTYAPDRRYKVGLLIWSLLTSEDRGATLTNWKDSSDPMLRAVAARIAALRAAPEELAWAFADADAFVR